MTCWVWESFPTHERTRRLFEANENFPASVILECHFKNECVQQIKGRNWSLRWCSLLEFKLYRMSERLRTRTRQKMSGISITWRYISLYVGGLTFSEQPCQDQGKFITLLSPCCHNGLCEGRHHTQPASLTGSTNFEHFSITISPISSSVLSQEPRNHQMLLKFSGVSLTSFINKRNSLTENKKEVRQSKKQGSISRL